MKAILNSFYNKISSRLVNYFIIDESEALLKKSNVSLLVFNNSIINLATGASCHLSEEFDGTAQSGNTAQSIALAAQKIIPKNIKTPAITLFLPANEFIATSYQLPKIDRQRIVPVLHYQQSELLPACTDSLLVVASTHSNHHENKALWFSKKRSEQLFATFKDHRSILLAIFPASFLFSVNNKSDDIVYCEQGKDYLLVTQFAQQNLRHWDFYIQSDLTITEFDQQFKEQWQAHYPHCPFANKNIIANKDTFLAHIDKFQPNKDYAFYPPQAKHLIQKEHQRRKMRRFVFMACFICLLIALPFVKNSLDYRQVNQNYLMRLQQTEGVRSERENVLNYEQKWLAFEQYPQHDLYQMMLKINRLIPKDSWLSSFELANGVVEIEGYSPSPSKLLELLAQQKEFDNAAFNQNIRSERGKNKEHFGIIFHLADHDEKTYYEEFFPRDE